MNRIDEIRNVQIKWFRWLIRHDMPAVLSMECQTDTPWVDEDWLVILRQRNAIGMVAEDQFGRVVGAILYELYSGHLKIIRLIVDESCRRQGIATEMLSRMKHKLAQQRRHELVIDVPERQQDMLLFLKSCGFLVHGYEKNSGGPYGDDLLIEMRYVLDREEVFDEDDICEGRH